jgi:hypothetical protein
VNESEKVKPIEVLGIKVKPIEKVTWRVELQY